MGRPYFSAVINNYNYGRFLAKAIDSILAQDFPKEEIEIIVVDDGSTDDSRSVAARYKDRVTLIAQENLGQAAAMNAGLSAAQGEVACLLDADDFWHPRKLAAVAEALKDPKLGLAQHCQYEVDAAGRELPTALPDWPPVFTLDDLLTRRFDYGATSSLALRRTVLQKILPIPRELFVFTDVYLVDYGLLHADMANIREVLGYHRLHGANNWAGTYRDAGKLARSIKEARAYRALFEPELKARGRAWTHRCFVLQEHELLRRELLIASHQRRRLDILRMLPRLWRACGGGAFALFRCSTCLLAAVHPELYLSFYALYSRLRSGGA